MVLNAPPRGTLLPPPASSGCEPEDLPRDNSRAIGLAVEVNRQVRRSLLRQSWLTNKFVGSPLARDAERAYADYVTRHELPKVRRRLLGLALLIPLVQIAHAPRSYDKGAYMYMVMSTALPALMLLIAALLCTLDAARARWSHVVAFAIVLADGGIVWSDLLLDMSDFTPRDKDFHTMWELARMLGMVFACSMLFSLNMHTMYALLIAQYVLYTLASIVLYVIWWHTSGQGPWTWAMHLTSIDSPGSGLEELNKTCAWLQDHIEGRVRPHNLSHSSVLVDCVVLSTIALITMLIAVRRMNRFDRASFVNSFALHGTVSDAEQLLSGRRVELLALFSNPSLLTVPGSDATHPGTVAPPSYKLGPLRLGRELKSLLRAVPAPYVYIEPAATLPEVRAAIVQHNPQIALFSGHSLMGSLVFELPDGTMDLPNADVFLEVLAAPSGTTSRLRCLVLNGCNTLDLAVRVVSQSPHLYVVCWASLAEDSASRGFAAGFYAAAGAQMLARELVDIESAYRAGFDTFISEGFVFGDPATYMHPAGHPHLAAPRFDCCEGCSPPVHGEPVLVRSIDGEVQVVAGLETWAADDRRVVCRTCDASKAASRAAPTKVTMGVTPAPPPDESDDADTPNADSTSSADDSV